MQLPALVILSCFSLPIVVLMGVHHHRQRLRWNKGRKFVKNRVLAFKAKNSDSNDDDHRQAS